MGKQTGHTAVPEFPKGLAITINLLQRSIIALKAATFKHFQPLPTFPDLLRPLPSLGEQWQGNIGHISFKIKTNLILTISIFGQILNQFKPGWAPASARNVLNVDFFLWCPFLIFEPRHVLKQFRVETDVIQISSDRQDFHSIWSWKNVDSHSEVHTEIEFLRSAIVQQQQKEFYDVTNIKGMVRSDYGP